MGLIDAFVSKADLEKATGAFREAEEARIGAMRCAIADAGLDPYGDAASAILRSFSAVPSLRAASESVSGTILCTVLSRVADVLEEEEE